ncbi:sensor histidine kinase [Paramicrobacterium chengjingii]|uniref:histidine kinase n=1 Tax=Paramicrobacterium chengjingii TaxID=2769067 RepID=A0ABX6YEJ1_9MICO|nr:sensor histidine kinase [Microbacterium chengjingii]QPZ37214.1 sensor histidine kinase [Microbacterium chengjingii]
MPTTSGPEPVRFRMPPALRLWLPVALSGVVQISGTVWALARTNAAADASLALAVALALIGPVALIFTRRFAGLVAVITIVAAAADLLLAPSPQPPPIAMIFGVIIALIHGKRLWVYIALVIAWSTVLLFGSAAGLSWHPARVVGTTLALGILIVVGESIRHRRQRATERWQRIREQRARAEREERVRIARDLHDVIAHSLSQISVQAGVGLHLMDAQPEQARTALQNIKTTSKDALDEVRGVLGVLRGDDAPLAPAPGLDQIGDLVSANTAVAVSFERADVGHAPDAVQQAAYRIVQESLTNVVRHANAAHAVVTVVPRGRDLVVSVADDGRGGARESGNGVLGMRERAELLGGTLHVETGASGTTVTAYLPVGKETT